MTATREKAEEAAYKIVVRVLAFKKDADPLDLALGMVEDAMAISNTKSFKDAMGLLHKAVKKEAWRFK